MGELLMKGGRAFGRLLAGIAAEHGVQIANQVGKAAVADRGTDRELNGENVCFKSLASAENVCRILQGAGLPADRVAPLCKRMRTGTAASWSPTKEGVTKAALIAHLEALGFRKPKG